jgi:hypothetical protein
MINYKVTINNRNFKVPQFPHCDAKVLHGPEDGCKYCNESELQGVREAWGINYTGHYDVHKSICPSEQERSLDIINKWPGNRIKYNEVDDCFGV